MTEGLFDAKRDSVNEEIIISTANIKLFRIIATIATDIVTIPTIQYQSAVFSVWKCSIVLQDILFILLYC
jgi:hypothetical protein